MAEKEIARYVQDLKDEWGPLLKVSPLLELDDTWPSLGVIDLLTFCTRDRETLLSALEPMMKGCAAYLAVQVGRCWKRFCDDVSFEETADGIAVIGRGGEFIPEGERLRYPVEKEFRQVLEAVPNPLPMFKRFDIPLAGEGNVVSLLGLSMAIGLGPAVQGPWENYQPGEQTPWVDAVVRQIAGECASHYGRVFPDEPVGQVAELYLAGLLYPPPLYGERLPFFRAVEQFLELFKEYRFSAGAVRQFGYNLSRSPDPILSSMGLVLSGALAETMPPPEVLAAAWTKGRYMGLLRPAMVRFRKGFLELSDWVPTGLQSEQDELRFAIESEMGFLPWLQLDPGRLKAGDYNRLMPIVSAACDFNLQAGIKAIDEILEQEPEDLSLRIQRVKFETIGGDIERAERMLGSLVSEPGASRYPRLFNLWGQCLLAKSDPEGAKRRFLEGLKAAEKVPLLAAELANNAAWSGILLGETEQPLALIEQGLEATPCPVTLLLNKAAILWELRDFDSIRETRLRVFELAPCDRRVFASLALTDAALRQLQDEFFQQVQ
ncbi:MAG: hypothetical protein KDD69_00430 [Bdellovibrionales bacterium]|nr:hypothetical protein [Bdellovibrionales bacterium]